MKRISMDEVETRDIIGTERGLCTVEEIQRGYIQPEFTRLDCVLTDGSAEAVILRNTTGVMLHHRPFRGSEREYLEFLDKTRDVLDDVDINILRLGRPKNGVERAEARVRLRVEVALLQERLEELLLSLPLEE